MTSEQREEQTILRTQTKDCNLSLDQRRQRSRPTAINPERNWWMIEYERDFRKKGLTWTNPDLKKLSNLLNDILSWE